MTVTIPLTQGQVTYVDDDFGDLAQYNWCAQYKPSYGRGGAYFAVRNVPTDAGKYKTTPLHRVILSRILGRELRKEEYVDHIDINPLNNRRANLRLATAAQNGRNRPLQKNNTSGFKGVSFRRDREKWEAQIGHQKGVLHLGLFDTPDEAHEAYRKAADVLHKAYKNYG